MRFACGVALGTSVLLCSCFNPATTPQDTDVGGSSGTGAATTDTLTTGGASTTLPVDTSASDGGTTVTDPTTNTTATTAMTTTMTTSVDDSTGQPPLECVDGVIETGVGSGVVQVSTAPASDSFTGSCGGSSSFDVAYQWDVPFTDFYVIDTQGSDFDTILYLLDDCGGDELSCNDNATGSVSSEVVGSFEMGDRVVVVIDGNAGETGNAVLNINTADCPSADLSRQALPATFSNVAGTNAHGGACGGEGNLERAFRYRAPAEGLYTFEVDSEEFTPAIYLEDGPVCGGTELACNGPAFGHAEIMRALSAGDYVTIYVDSTGGAGDFDINITELGATCPEQTFEEVFQGNINTFSNTMSSSCGPSGFEESGIFFPFDDATFAWTSPGQIGSNSGCDIMIRAGFPMALSLQEGACDGPEIQCSEGVFDETNVEYMATVSVGHIPPTDFTIAVSPTSAGFSWISPQFTLEVICFAIG